MTLETNRIGKSGEAIAEQFLIEQGYQILARNWRPANLQLQGEIDLVARDGRIHVFVEVKTRSSSKLGSPLEAITQLKLNRMRALAKAWMHSVQPPPHPKIFRLDAIGVVLKGDQLQIEHLTNVG